MIRVRAELLLKLNMVFYKLFKFVSHDFRLHPETNHGKHYKLKSFILPTLRYLLVKDQMSQVPIYEIKREYICSVTIGDPLGGLNE